MHGSLLVSSIRHVLEHACTINNNPSGDVGSSAFHDEFREGSDDVWGRCVHIVTLLLEWRNKHIAFRIMSRW